VLKYTVIENLISPYFKNNVTANFVHKMNLFLLQK